MLTAYVYTIYTVADFPHFLIEMQTFNEKPRFVYQQHFGHMFSTFSFLEKSFFSASLLVITFDLTCLSISFCTVHFPYHRIMTAAVPFWGLDCFQKYWYAVRKFEVNSWCQNLVLMSIVLHVTSNRHALYVCAFANFIYLYFVSPLWYTFIMCYSNAILMKDFLPADNLDSSLPFLSTGSSTTISMILSSFASVRVSYFWYIVPRDREAAPLTNIYFNTLLLAHEQNQATT